MPTSEPDAAGAADLGSSGTTLTVDLDAVAANYALLRDKVAPAECAAVVKADAYGLGAERVAPALAARGCRVFFVAHLDEGLALRAVLPEVEIIVFNGAQPGAESYFPANRLIPVLNDLAAVDAWSKLARTRGAPQPAALHLDTGMSRLGLPAAEVDTLAADPARLDGVEARWLMSHLACAEETDNPMSAAQRDAFDAARARLPTAPASLANSSGIFLGDDYHFDLVRPGAALYGVNPLPGQANPMSAAIRLEARILQVRDVDSPRTVGYGASHRIAGRTRIATVAVGYADGYLRSLSGRGSCCIGETRVPVVGRVSMDLITLDVSAVPPGIARPGAVVEIIGERTPVDAVAEAAGTIGYEILTGLGRRYHRRYLSRAPLSSDTHSHDTGGDA